MEKNTFGDDVKREREAIAVSRILRGQIESGSRSFSFWMAKLHAHYVRVSGLQLVPGTLNVRLSEPFRRTTQFRRLEREEYGGTVSVSLIPCKVFGRAAFILRTDKAEFEDDETCRCLIEIATDVHLRETFGVKDGDWIEVIVSDE